MKIRMINDLQDSIDAEMAWRKRELSAILATVKGSRNFAKDTAIRAAIALLYAHWEGAIKNLATYYLEYVSALKLPYGELKPNFLAISLKSSLDSFSESNKSAIHTKIVTEIINSDSVRSAIPTRVSSKQEPILTPQYLRKLWLQSDSTLLAMRGTMY